MEVQEDASSLLLRSYKDGKWSDITIMNGHKEYRVHKHVLSDAIPYFDKMFSSEFSESTSQVIKLDFPSTVFDLIIEWAYCAKILITEENAVELFHLADYMNISKLTTECLNFLWNNFSDSPLIDIEHWINEIVTGEVHEIIDGYICSNFLDIVHTNAFLQYDVDTVDYIISLDHLHIDNEIQVLDAIIRWAEINVERRSHLSKLLKKVHWVDINGFQFMNRIDKLSWIMHDRTRSVIMAAVELSFFKSLKQIHEVNNVNSKPRYELFSFHYAIYRKTDSSIIADNFNGNYGKIIFSENRSLPPGNFGDSHITEHCMDSDVVIRIDWKNKTYRLFKDSDFCYILLFGRLFRFNKNDRKIHFWKGERLLEDASLSNDNTTSQSTFTISKRKGRIYISIINPTSGSSNQNRNENHREYKSLLTINKCFPYGNKSRVVASHEIVTKEPIKMLKSTILHDLLVIFVDCSLIILYDFQKNIFKEHKNDLNGDSLCFLHFRSVVPKLLIFNNDVPQSSQGFDIDDRELFCWPGSYNPYPKLTSSLNLIGFISFESKLHNRIHGI